MWPIWYTSTSEGRTRGREGRWRRLLRASSDANVSGSALPIQQDSIRYEIEFSPIQAAIPAVSSQASASSAVGRVELELPAASRVASFAQPSKCGSSLNLSSEFWLERPPLVQREDLDRPQRRRIDKRGPSRRGAPTLELGANGALFVLPRPSADFFEDVKTFSLQLCREMASYQGRFGLEQQPEVPTDAQRLSPEQLEVQGALLALLEGDEDERFSYAQPQAQVSCSPAIRSSES